MNIKELAKIFDVKLSWCHNRKRMIVLDELKNKNYWLSRHFKSLNNCKEKEKWFVEWQIRELNNEIDKLNKRKDFLNILIKNCKLEEQGKPVKNKMINYDIEEIKKVPIDRLVKVNRAGFFKLRDEKTPSVKWYKNENRWYDFGSCEGGDVVDIYMKLNGCKLIEALRDLSTM